MGQYSDGIRYSMLVIFFSIFAVIRVRAESCVHEGGKEFRMPYFSVPSPANGTTDEAGRSEYDEHEYMEGSKFHFAINPADYLWLSLGVNGNVISSADLNKAFQLEFTSGRYVDNYNYIQITGRYGWGYIKDKSLLNDIMEKQLSIFSFGLEFKSLFPSFYTDLVQYFLAGIDFNCYSWKYKDPLNCEYHDPVTDEAYNWSIDKDRLNACDIHMGFGIILAQTSGIQFCSEFSPGFLFVGTESSESAENVLLKNTFYFRVKLALYFAYREL